MPRKYRITDVGFYHVINRGVERRNVFLEDKDFEKFIELLQFIKNKFKLKVHSFCLMTNHYHLLIETLSDNISDAMRYINSMYSSWFNKKYRRSGHLWQGRFKSYYLYDDAHFWIVSKYIERNPIEAKMVSNIEEYSYQSLFMWNNDDKNLLSDSMIFNMNLNEYKAFVNDAFDEKTVSFIYSTPKITKNSDGAIMILNKRLSSFFETTEDFTRNQKILNANSYGYTQTEIANYLDLSVSAINKIVAKKVNYTTQ